MKKVFTESEVKSEYKNGKKVLVIGLKDILTPSAKDVLKEYGMEVVRKNLPFKEKKEKPGMPAKPTKSTVAVGSDHTGYELKKMVTEFLKSKSFEVVDEGTYNDVSCDYSDFAFKVAQQVALNSVNFGIILDATGIPSAITANKIPGIRAATCYNEFSAKSAREHNNANVLVLGAKTLGEESVKSILQTWINTDFAGGRHQRRLDKIKLIEEKFVRKK